MGLSPSYPLAVVAVAAAAAVVVDYLDLGATPGLQMSVPKL